MKKAKKVETNLCADCSIIDEWADEMIEREKAKVRPLREALKYIAEGHGLKIGADNLVAIAMRDTARAALTGQK